MIARARRADGGFSLPEVLVAMALTSLLLAALGSIFLTNLRTTSKISAKVEATSDARLVVDTMSRRLRVAVPPPGVATAAFTSFEPRTVTFYASISGGALGSAAPSPIDPTPTKVEYKVVRTTYDGQATDCVQETLTPGVGASPFTYPVAGAKVRCLAYGTFNADGTPLLTYFQSGAGSAPPTGARDIRSVALSVKLTSASGGQSATTSAATRVSLPNIRPRGTT